MSDAERTEPRYFTALRSDKRLGRLTVHKAGGLDPQRLVAEVARLREDAEDDGDPYTDVWCVFDRDERGGVAEACALAEGAGLRVALSNPCFEVWYLLHYRYRSRHMTAKQALTELRKHIPGYDKDSDVYKLLLPKQADALANAQRLRDEHVRNGRPETHNPSTTVDLLVLRLNEFART